MNFYKPVITTLSGSFKPGHVNYDKADKGMEGNMKLNEWISEFFYISFLSQYCFKRTDIHGQLVSNLYALHGKEMEHHRMG